MDAVRLYPALPAGGAVSQGAGEAAPRPPAGGTVSSLGQGRSRVFPIPRGLLCCRLTCARAAQQAGASQKSKEFLGYLKCSVTRQVWGVPAWERGL